VNPTTESKRFQQRRLLDLVAPMVAAAVLAILLVDHGSRRSLLASDHGVRGLRVATHIRGHQDVPRPSDPAGWSRSPSSGYRPGQGAGPQAAVRGRRGQRLELKVQYLSQRRHLPLVELREVA
jgi:hypothetical protein